MIEQASLIIGDGNWAVKSDSLLGYALPQGKYTPREMSVVRATTGTRVNAEGLVEVVPYNLMEYSQALESTAYTTGGTGTLNVTPNYAVAPDGTMTADRIQITRGAVYQELYQRVNTNTGQQYTLSFWAKSLSGTPTLFTNFNSPYENQVTFTNDWVRYEYTYVASGSGTGFNLITWSALPTTSLSADLLVWGAQLVEGSTALDYLPTTTRLNIARIDYSTGSPALLVEPQRTNLLTYSSSFDNAVWTKVQTTTSANVAVSPSGIQDADKLIPNTTSNIHYSVQNISDTIAPWTFSVYAKADGYNRIILNAYNTNFVGFNLTTGTIESTLGIGVTSANIEDAGNGWYRCSITSTSTSSGVSMTMSVFNAAYTNGNANPIFSGNGTDGVLVWGAQVEAASYTTSYIPTTSASVTRNADQVLKTGISSLIGTEFTLFYDGFETTGGVSTRYIILKGSGGTYANAVFIEGAGLERIALTILDSSNATIFNAISSSLTDGQRFKLAVRFKNNDFAFYVNGSQVATQASGIVPTFSDIYIGYYTDYSDNYSQVNSVAILKTALTNTQLAELTTL